MALEIRKASAESMLALVAVTGPAGAGKTLGSLLLAHGLGGKVVVIDSEVRQDRKGKIRGRSETYLGLCNADTGNKPLDFDVLPLEPPYTIERYSEALDIVWKAGYDVVVVDSLTHEWFGLLEQADNLKTQGGNQFTNVWGKLSPKHEKFIDKIMRSPSHLVCTMRSKMAYEIVDGKPKKLGMQPIQREGVDYQFEVIFDVSTDHIVCLSKANANYGQQLADEVIKKPKLTTALGEKLKVWLDGPAEPNQRLGKFIADLGTTPDRVPEPLSPDPEASAPTDPAQPVVATSIDSVKAAPSNTPVSKADLEAMEYVVPMKLAERVGNLPSDDTALASPDLNAFHDGLVEYLGGGEQGKKAAKDLWANCGVVVKKGVVVNRGQAVSVAKAAFEKVVTK